MQLTIILVSLIAFLAVDGNCQAAISGGLVWQGFSYEWLHHILNFETPHRLGSFGSALINQSVFESSDVIVNATFFSALTPGVVGDYAHPNVSSTAIVDENELITITHGSWEFSFEDISDNKTAPQANTLLNLTFPIETEMDPSALFLGGFDVRMLCLESGGGVCNSNASWVYKFQINISSFDPLTRTAFLAFTLNRAWAPADGSGKPFNTRMAFNVTVIYTCISALSDSYVNVTTDSITTTSTVYSPIAPQTRTMTGDFLGNVLLGMTGFGWELIETDNFANLGRYFEAVHFSIDEIILIEDNSVTYNLTMGVLSPKPTTYPSNVILTMDIVAISLPESIVLQQQPEYTSNICENSDSFTFHCASVNMQEQLTDFVPISISIG